MNLLRSYPLSPVAAGVPDTITITDIPGDVYILNIRWYLDIGETSQRNYTMTNSLGEFVLSMADLITDVNLLKYPLLLTHQLIYDAEQNALLVYQL